MMTTSPAASSTADPAKVITRSLNAPFAAGPDADIPADGAVTSQKRQDLLTALLNKKLLREEDFKKLKPSESNLLKNLQCAEIPGGGYTVFGTDGKTPIADVKKGIVSIHKQGAEGSTEHIDSILQGEVLTKASFGTNESAIRAHDEKSFLMMAKAAELVGDDKYVINMPPVGQRLKDKYPDLDAKMETEWAKMQAQNQPKPDSPQVRKSAAADVTGLTQPSTIATDKTPPLTPQFAAKANPQIAATTPTPAAPGVSPPQIARPGAPM